MSQATLADDEVAVSILVDAIEEDEEVDVLVEEEDEETDDVEEKDEEDVDESEVREARDASKTFFLAALLR